MNNFAINMPKIMNAAFSHMIANNNFMHTPLHAARVYDNAFMIYEMEALNLNEEELSALAISCFWHDVGRIDLNEQKDNHEEASVELLTSFNEETRSIPETVLELSVSIISSHRNRGGDIVKEKRNCLQNILWDADKLDIFNFLRIQEIVNLYKNGITGGEFTPVQTFSFWSSIDESFVEKFSFNISRRLASQRITKFIQVTKELAQCFQQEKEHGHAFCL